MRYCFQGAIHNPFHSTNSSFGAHDLICWVKVAFSLCIILQLQTLNINFKLTDSILWDHSPLFAISFGCVLLHFSNLNNLVSSSDCVTSLLTLCFQTPSKMSRETCVPVTKWGNPANGVCQPARGKWVVKEESEHSCCQFPALGKKVPPTGMNCCAACQERRLLPHSYSSRRHRWWTAKKHLLSKPECSV